MRTAALRLCVPLALVLVSPLSAPAEPVPTDPLGGTGGGPIDGSLLVRVVRDGTVDPIAGAFVMVGPHPGVPFEENWGFASAEGEILFEDPGLIGPIAVTAAAEGSRTLSLLEVDAADIVVPLRPLEPAGPVYEIGDFVGGIDVDNGPFHAGDGNLDLAIVLPSLGLSDLLAFDLESLFGPPEIIDILGEQIEIPSNVFIPQQWELFIEIIKDRYSLHLPEGEQTLAALSGRIPVDAVLEGGEIPELLPMLQWREIDRLDWNVTGDTGDADLFVDPDLTETASLTLSNVPDGSIAYCVSGGDLDGEAGLGRLVPLGLASLDCPAGSGPCAGTIGLTTTPATGEFTGMTYFPMVGAQRTGGDDLVVIVDRADRPPDYDVALGSFFDWLDLGYTDGRFAWNDVENAGNGSPEVDVQVSRITDPAVDRVVWELFAPGPRTGFEPPLLPPEAPAGLAEGSEYRWEHVSLGLGFDHPFDFDAFSFSEILAHGSHGSLDRRSIVYEPPPASVPGSEEGMERLLLAARPNPFREDVAVSFHLPRSEEVEVSVLTVGGRRVADLAGGTLAAGPHRFVWSGRDGTGRRLPSGLYFVRVALSDRTTTRPILLLH
ncbi:MAG: hypothetical protein GF346_04185 [Candidatus Eisenbacteria bacterium]|nr:hypothetical protein [Candidatus Latescibacterota bacterium]MBD3301625.1 hypothetical protein [Candidatus Eisenbacteria bacterium]